MPAEARSESLSLSATAISALQLIALQSHLGIDNGKANGHGQVHPGLEKRDDFGATSRCSHHQHILRPTQKESSIGRVRDRPERPRCRSAGSVTLAHLCITQDGVVEEDAEEHSTKGNDFLPGEGLNPQESLRWSRVSCCGSRLCSSLTLAGSKMPGLSQAMCAKSLDRSRLWHNTSTLLAPGPEGLLSLHV